MGAHVVDGLTRFAVRATTPVTLCLFAGDTERRIAMHETDGIWTVEAPAPPGTRYGYRVALDPAKLLVDPYAVELDRRFAYDPRLGAPGVDTAALVPRAIVQYPIVLPDPPPPLFAPGGWSTNSTSAASPCCTPTCRRPSAVRSPRWRTRRSSRICASSASLRSS